MSEAVRYITDEEGKRVGVLLDLDTYEQLAHRRKDSDLLTDLSKAELEALAKSRLATKEQSLLDGLLQRNRDGTLSSAEENELDALLVQIDQLDILKTRARYTLQILQERAQNA